MGTNNAQVLAQVAQQHGFNLSGGEITLILGLGSGLMRYLHLECAYIMAQGGLVPLVKKFLGITKLP